MKTSLAELDSSHRACFGCFFINAVFSQVCQISVSTSDGGISGNRTGGDDVYNRYLSSMHWGLGLLVLRISSIK